ncbi:unnamed protein product [Cuscuta campestris]|uniref:Uncharacterized protein n=1 Tax=Cuscuta campestris TaxID=132261 RepID=A0A484KXM4_9ASTE|nr:unnamed protein product [Cuscuta campestris]
MVLTSWGWKGDGCGISVWNDVTAIGACRGMVPTPGRANGNIPGRKGIPLVLLAHGHDLAKALDGLLRGQDHVRPRGGMPLTWCEVTGFVLELPCRLVRGIIPFVE